MQTICIWCGSALDAVAIQQEARRPITKGLCTACRNDVVKQGDISALVKFLDESDAPLLLMQGNPRQVVTANQEACALVGKDLSRIEQHRGGQVFDCIHSLSEAGCGKDKQCENCKIKNAVVGTFITGTSFNGVSTILEIKKHAEINAYDIQVTTEKVGDYALLKIDRYERRD